MPRVLCSKEEEDFSGGGSEREEQGEPEEKEGIPQDVFVPNPEEQRAKAEQRRQQQMQSHGRYWRNSVPAKNHDVVGM